MAESFDFEALEVKPAELPSQQRAAKPNPFEPRLAESYAEWTADHDKGGRQVTVPVKHAKALTNMIRRAADKLEIGSRIVIEDPKGRVIGTQMGMPNSGNVTVKFCGRDRRERSA